MFYPTERDVLGEGIQTMRFSNKCRNKCWSSPVCITLDTLDVGWLRPPMVPNSKQGSAEDDWLGWVSPGPAGGSARYETSDSPLAAAIFKASTLRAGVRRAGS